MAHPGKARVITITNPSAEKILREIDFQISRFRADARADREKLSRLKRKHHAYKEQREEQITTKPLLKIDQALIDAEAEYQSCKQICREMITTNKVAADHLFSEKQIMLHELFAHGYFSYPSNDNSAANGSEKNIDENYGIKFGRLGR